MRRDTWVTDDLFTYNASAGANLWQVAFGLGNFDTAGNWQPISTWASAGGFTPSPNSRNFSASSVVYGLSLGVGSGWNTFDGAVDNVSIGITGALAQGDSYQPGKQGVRIYFTVTDIDETLRRAVDAGGKVLYPKTSIGEHGFVAEFEDSEGNCIATRATDR